MELPGMAELTTLMVIVTLAPASLALADNVIDCTSKTGVQQGKEVTEEGAEVTVRCKTDATVMPAAASASNDLKDVYKDSQCEHQQPLIQICPDATASVEPTTKVVTINIKQLPKTKQTFYVKCKNQDTTTCIAEVSVKGLQATDAGGGEGTGVGAGGGAGAGSNQQPGGTTNVQTCKQVNTSITVKIPQKGSSAQFACEKDFTLYPSSADKIFSEDCKKQETLKNMTRSQAQGDESQTIFTLTADKNPSKKKLCYLCARAGVSESKPGTAKDYCMIYVESSARTPFALGSTLALMLPCVLAALHFT